VMPNGVLVFISFGVFLGVLAFAVRLAPFAATVFVNFMRLRG